ncbi:nuclease domain-containing protein [Pseudomonas sp. Irchel s3h17]|uniref:nuclease domain-containing protein n=1 Tax=Pseudomonas sp. Irchel s3h17 TaxID=2009182 RepID=UPI000BA36F24|nr:nuclease domain-containing protein [Pseudomonas sp. Irchel s3h17]
MTFILRVERDGTFFDLDPGTLNTGFMEKGAYRFAVVEGYSFYIDDIRLDDSSHQGGRAWCWSPGYFAGEVVAELLNELGETVATYRLDVSADDKKLGGESYADMVNTILNFDPSLLFGTEEAQLGIGTLGALINPHLQYARLRRYGDRMLGALVQVSQKPLTSLRTERTAVSAHQVKRLDVSGVRKALMSPAGLALLHQGNPHKPPLNIVRFDVSTAYEEQDNPANQALGLVLSEVIRRCRQVCKSLKEVVATESFSETRSPLSPRLARRIAFIDRLLQKLERIQRTPPFRDLTQRRLSAAGLNAISAQPIYARAYRFGWYALRTGVLGQEKSESLWLSPSWEIYERWCFVIVVNQLKCHYPDLKWKRRSSSMKAGRILWRGVGDGITLDVWFQVRCPAIDRKPYHGFSSLSRLRLPDIVVTMRSPKSQRFIVLDAKYRSSRFGVLDGMASAHLYHDSLSWEGRKPDASLLLIPRGGAVPTLESAEYQFAHGVGALVVRDRLGSEAVGNELKRILTAEIQI